MNEGDSTKSIVKDSEEIDNNLVQIKSIIRQHGGFEPINETERRKAVFKELVNLVNNFVDNIKRSKGRPDDDLSCAQLFPFGSYRLDVCGTGTDIDTLCVAPKYVTRDEFFSEFGTMLKNHPSVTDYLEIPRAYVPVIKLKYNEIEVDVLFAQVNLESIPEDLQFNQDELLRDLDLRCIRGLNGCRNTDEILNSVGNLEVFRLALRVIKLWAKRRGIYSNMLGYLGGFACAMLVAKAASMHPNADVPTLINKFFVLFSRWHWPEPVLLKKLEKGPPGMNYVVWDPNLERLNLMPIITPAYPQQNSTHNITKSSFKVITEEFRRGCEVTNKIINENEKWTTLFEEPNFFSIYIRYFVVTATAESKESFKKWTGLVVSKIRILIGSLDRNPDVEVAHVNDKTFTSDVKTSEGKIIYTQHWFIGIRYEPSSQMYCLFIPEQQSFRLIVTNQSMVQKINSPDLSISTSVVPAKDLNKYLSPKDLPMLPPEDDSHENTSNGFLSNNTRQQVINNQSHHMNDNNHPTVPTSNNINNGGMGDSSAFNDHHKTNRNCFNSTTSDLHLAGTKRKSPTSMSPFHNNFPQNPFLCEPPFKCIKDRSGDRAFPELTPPGTEVPPGTEPLPPGTESYDSIRDLMNTTPIKVSNGQRLPHPANNIVVSGASSGYNSGAAGDYAAPIPVIGVVSPHMVSPQTMPPLSSSPIPTLMTSSRWTTPQPQQEVVPPQNHRDVRRPSSRSRRSISSSSSSKKDPSESPDSYYESGRSKDSSPSSTSKRHNHNHKSKFSSDEKKKTNTKKSLSYDEDDALTVDDSPRTSSAAPRRIVTCTGKKLNPDQSSKVNDLPRRQQQPSDHGHHRHHSKHYHRRNDSSRFYTSSRNHQRSRIRRDESPDTYDERRSTKTKKRTSVSSLSSHNSNVLVRSRSSF